MIARGGQPAVRLLVPAGQTTVRLGLLEGIVDPSSVPDFLEPMDADELAAWNGDETKADDRKAHEGKASGAK